MESSLAGARRRGRIEPAVAQRIAKKRQQCDVQRAQRRYLARLRASPPGHVNQQKCRADEDENDRLMQRYDRRQTAHDGAGGTRPRQIALETGSLLISNEPECHAGQAQPERRTRPGWVNDQDDQPARSRNRRRERNDSARRNPAPNGGPDSSQRNGAHNQPHDSRVSRLRKCSSRNRSRRRVRPIDFRPISRADFWSQLKKQAPA